MRKRCITFAGAVGSSKTPIAYYLSWNTGLPIFSNDGIRSEIVEDCGKLMQAEYLGRRDSRLRKLMDTGVSFIYDASVDRTWVDVKKIWMDLGYDIFVISLNLSDTLLRRLYIAKQYNESLVQLERLIREHREFVQQSNSDIGLNISDVEFPFRLEKSLAAVSEWLKR